MAEFGALFLLSVFNWEKLSLLATMGVTPNPQFEHFLEKARNGLAFHQWKGDSWRFASMDYASKESILSGEGSMIYGARWNAIGSFPAIYGSTAPEVAVLESRADQNFYQIKNRSPKVMVCLRVDLLQVIDLREPEAVEWLKLSAEQLFAEEWRGIRNARESLTQCVGRVAYELGAEGLIVPSAQTQSGENIIVFPDQLQNPQAVSIWEEAQLKRFDD